MNFSTHEVFLQRIENFSERGHKFSRIYEMNFTTFGNKRHMTNECYIEQPKQIVGMNVIMIIRTNPHLIKARDRKNNHASFGKYGTLSLTN